MTTSERIEKTEALSSYLLGIELALAELNIRQWPTSEIRAAIGYVGKAKREIDKEIANLKQKIAKED